MGSGAVIYVPSFIKIGSGIQKLIGRDTQTATWSHNPTLFYQNKESGLKSRDREIVSESCKHMVLVHTAGGQ
jgi:hypothetical protein